MTKPFCGDQIRIVGSEIEIESHHRRKIIHVDMDAFYAEAEIVRRPHLKDRPVAVGGSPNGRGVVSTANYHARKFGVRSALSCRRAVQICPELVFVRPDFPYYKSLSKQIRKIFSDHAEKIQPLSLDEAYLDVTDSKEFDNSATRIALQIKKEIFEETGLTASAGVAPNKFLAKIASDWKKPNGLFVISPAQVESFVEGLPVGKIPGVGKKSAQRLQKKGFFTCGDLKKEPLQNLTSWFGRWGEYLYQVSRGIDLREVKSGGVRKSLSLERTYGVDLQNLEAVLDQVPQLYENLQERIHRAKLTHPISSFFVKVKFHDFSQTTKERRFGGALSEEAFRQLFEDAFLRSCEPVRLLGLGIRFEVTEKRRSAPGQMDLF